MPVIAQDIRFYATDNSFLGGNIDAANEVPDAQLHALFDPVLSSEVQAGMTDYRCVFIANISSTDTLLNAGVYLDRVPTNPGVDIQLGLGAANAGQPEPTIVDENTAPASVTFSAADSVANAISLGNLAMDGIAQNGYRALWIRRTVTTAATPAASESFSMTVFGDTI